jgi:hypothetical protein
MIGLLLKLGKDMVRNKRGKEAEIKRLSVRRRTATRREGLTGTSLKEDGARAGRRGLSAIVLARRRAWAIRAGAEKAG